MIKLFKRVNLLRQEYSLAINRRKLRERYVHSCATRRIIRKSTRTASFKVKKVDLVFPDLIKEARAFHERNGYFPISFSRFGDGVIQHNGNKKKTLSATIPGRPYSFNSYDLYLEEYQESVFAITHKKGGWDCYRHIEILESGCIPLMHDAKNIPEGSMFYYPKELFMQIYDDFAKGIHYQYEDLQEYLTKWFSTYLTSKAAVHSMLNLANISINDRRLKCLFLDLELNEKLDYLSAMVLSGLIVQDSLDTMILGDAPRYMFEDFDADTSGLYGRGFGYTKILSKQSRVTTNIHDTDFKNFNFVVVGNSLRNRNFLEENRDKLSGTRLILVDGRDEPIDQESLTWLKSFSDAVLFVRESFN